MSDPRVDSLLDEALRLRLTRRGIMRRGAALGLSTAAIAGILSSAARTAAAAEDYSNAERKDTVVFDTFGAVDTPDLWNPLVPGINTITGLRQAMMEPLMILNYKTGELDGWLAESFTANDTLDAWTLTLRDGITWSDGEPLTADDVIFTVDLVKKTEGVLWHDEMNAWVDSMTKVDDHTVEFTLTGPNPRFVLDHFAVKIGSTLSPLPQHIWEGQDPLTFKNYDPEQGLPIFSGPYTLSSISTTDFVLVRDDQWWGAATGFQPLPAPKKLVWSTSANEEVKVARMANDEIDALHDISLGAFQALQAQNPNVIVWHTDAPYSWPDPCPRPLDINNSIEPWTDKDMRWALNYVIDRDQIVEIAYENTTTKLDGIFPGYAALNAYMAKLPPEWVKKLWTTDPDKAAEILTAKGYTKDGDYWQKDGQPLTLEIPTLQGDSESIRAVDVLVEQLQPFGIDAVNKITEPGTLYNNVDLGNYVASWGDYTCGSVNEPWASMNTLAGDQVAPNGERATGAQGNGNVFRWANPEYTDLVNQIGSLPLGDPKIDPLFIDAMKIFYDELPAIPLFQAKKLLPFNTTYWTNWPTAENDYVVPAHWWQSTLVILTNLQPVA
jgi:peptide/nickel transport system substrate-binding protein